MNYLNLRQEIEKEIGLLTDEEFRDFVALVRFGFDRIKAGEELADIFLEWLSRKGAAE